MKKVGIVVCLLLMLIITLSTASLTVKPTIAQTIPKPAVPEFTVSYIDRSYTTPVITTQTKDPYTGQLSTHRSGGNYVMNKTIEIKIKNQPYSPTAFPNGTAILLQYTLRAKGHFANWNPEPTTYWDLSRLNKQFFSSTSDYTSLTYVINTPTSEIYVKDGGQEDFQVKATVGYQYTEYEGNSNFYRYPVTKFAPLAESEWTETQTITATTNLSALPLSTLLANNLLLIITVPLIVAVIIILVLLKKSRKGARFTI
jgi:hypothetical protein